MTSIIKLQAFSGVQGETPPCYMLQVDEFRFLLDCGWDENFNMEYIENLKKHMPQVDAILLSYPDPLHLGALPYLVGKSGMTCRIYATIPVYKMGQMFMYDLYQSRHNTEDFNLFTLDDVDAAFDKIIQLKYSQTVSLKGKGHGLQITPLPGGHMIGGTIWKIVKDGEEEIVYAIDYNHKKERHLNGCLFEGIGRPSLLITDAFNADYAQPRRRIRDEQLMTNIVQTMRNGGNVLVCVDTAGRILELAHLLDQMWKMESAVFMAYSLALLNNVSYNVVEFAKSQVEWMSDKIMRAFEDQRNNPFQFKHVHQCHSIAELSQVPEPKVVLASIPDMQCGFSRDLFTQWCTNSKNTIILTNRTGPGTLARQLIDNPNEKSVHLEIRKRIRLEGAELEEYQKKEKERKAEEDRKKAELKKEAMESSDEEDEGEEAEVGGGGGGGGTVTKTKHDLMLKTEKHKTGFFKQAKKSYPMFPFVEEKLKWDDYGEIIRPEDFMIMDSGPVETTESERKKPALREDVEMQDVAEVPTKCVSVKQTLEIKANVLFIDFEGRSDGESIKKILAQIKPRHLAIVRGSPAATNALAEFAKSARDVVQGHVFIPTLNEVIDATTESHIYQVKLKDSVVSKLQFFKAREAEVAWIDARLDLTLTKAETETMEVDEDEKVKDEKENQDAVPSLKPIPFYQVPGHKAVFINEPKLSDFKQVLIKEGIAAEFSAGVLVCNNIVAIRRTEAGKLQLEGCLGEDYYKVRDLLYEQYAIV